MRLGRVAALSALVAGAVFLSSCSTLSRLNPIRRGTTDAQAEADRAKRIPVLALDEKLQPAAALTGVEFSLPAVRAITEWPTPSGPLDQSVENVDAAPNFQVAWRRRFGEKSGRRAHVTAPPISSGGRVFVMDGEAQVSAIDAASGQVVWRTNLNPGSRRDRHAFGGGIAISGARLYVSSGFRFVQALDVATGRVLWKQNTISPIHDAPNVSGGRVYTISVDNQLETFDAASGAPGWKYQALVEPARILAASSPALSGDTVVAAFSSGELVALSAANGTELWNQQLSRNSRTTALSEIRDIPGRPVVFRGDVMAGSHSGVFASVDLRTGQFRWDPLPISMLGTPWAAGDVIYVTSKAGEVVCVARSSGQVYWVRDLNAGRKQVRASRFLGLTKIDRPYWSGPILASNRLISVSTDGRLVALNPRTGEIMSQLRIGSPAVISPIAVSGQVFVVTEEAELIAIR
ncbi:MAG: enzyme repeat domain protein [Caulobacteraceae bacterium]|nr:enzyme repeat domain protein [Caulobacteraceae bacterium]